MPTPLTQPCWAACDGWFQVIRLPENRGEISVCGKEGLRLRIGPARVVSPEEAATYQLIKSKRQKGMGWQNPMGGAEPMAKNIKYAVAGEFLLALLKFLSRRVFVLLLGRAYLGLNGLFADVLSMLSMPPFLSFLSRRYLISPISR